MSYSAKILADSINSAGCRLTTVEVTYPLIVHAEHLRHRVFSFNVASARAIPTAKILHSIQEDMFYPQFYGVNKPGMAASEELTTYQIEKVNALIEKHRDATVTLLEQLKDIGLHKQTANRYALPFQYVTVIKSGTEWQNFFDLRCHKDAQPEIRKMAEMLKELYDSNTPSALSAGQWHIPMAKDKMDLFHQGFSMEQIRKIAVGRLCRVSYLTHDGKRNPVADLDLAESLLENKHFSPWEHVAQANNNKIFVRNFRGFSQLRSFVDGQ